VCNPEEGDRGEEARRQEGDSGQEDHREEARRQEGDSGQEDHREEARRQKAGRKEGEVNDRPDECKRRVMPAFFFVSRRRCPALLQRTDPFRGLGQISGDMIGRYNKLSFMTFTVAGEQVHRPRAGISTHLDVVWMVTHGERAR